MQSRDFDDEKGRQYKRYLELAANYRHLHTDLKSHLGDLFGDTQGRITAIEIGCGTGFTTGHILDAHPAILVAAVDCEAVMLAQAEQDLPASYAGRLLFVHSEATVYLDRLPEASVDLVVSGGTLHNLLLAERESMYTQIHRVLRPKGYFVNADKFVPHDHASQVLYDRGLADETLAILADCFETDDHELAVSWMRHDMSDEDPVRAQTVPATVDSLYETGFSLVETSARLAMWAIMTATK